MDYLLTSLIGVHSVALGLSTRPSGQLGPFGAQGSQGLVGPSGPSGSVGQVGSIGSKGVSGPSGLSGLPGTIGPTGSAPQGSRGPTGPEFILSRGLRAPDVIAYGLLRKVRGTSARILFQTTCAAVFFVSEQIGSGYGIPEDTLGLFTFIPKIGYAYSGPELAEAISLQAQQARWPLTVVFTNNKFVINCPYLFRVTDREYSESNTIVNGRYVGARYGECTRFFNHLRITVDISYQVPYNPGTAYSILEGLTLTTHIGFDPVPEKPTGLILQLNANPLIIDMFWQPNASAVSYGVFLRNQFETNPENWDQVFSPPVYNFVNLPVNNSFYGGVSSIGTYDESEPLMSSNYVLVSQPLPQSFNALAGGVVKTSLTVGIQQNQFVRLLDNESNAWPVNLTEFSQITSMDIRFYASINTGLPSDARITFGNDGPLVYYMYWRTVIKQEGDNTSNTEYPFAFASVENGPAGTKGPVAPPFNYATLFISDPNQLQNLFTNLDGSLIARPPDVTLFAGYPGTRLAINSTLPALSTFTIYYNLL